MKKTLAIILSIAMVLSVIVLPTTVSAAITTEPETVLQDFESQDFADKLALGVNGGYYSTNVALSGEQAHSGTKSMKVTNDVAWKQHLIPIGGGIGGNAVEFIVDFWIYADAGVTFNSLTTRVFAYNNAWWDGSSPAAGAGWNNVSVGNFTIPQAIAGTGWNHISFTYSCNNTYANQYFYLDITTKDYVFGGNVYIDDLRARKCDWADGGVIATLHDGYFDGANNDLVDYLPIGDAIMAPGTPKDLVFGGWYADEDYQTPITAYSEDVTDYYAKWTSAPYVHNIDFEGASYNTNNAGVLSTDFAKSGTHSMYYSDVSKMALEVGKINPGKTYGVDFYVYQPQANTTSAKIRTRLGRWPTHAEYSNGQVGNCGNLQLWENKATDGWKHFSFTITTPENLESICEAFPIQTYDTLWIVTEALRNNDHDKGPIYLDDVVVTEMTNAVEITFRDTYDYIDNNPVCVRQTGTPLADVPLARNGYIFDGWYTGQFGTGEKVTTVPSEKTTVFANWKAQTTTVINQGFESFGGTTITASDGTTVSVTDACAHSGDKSLAIVGTDVTWSIYGACIGNVASGATYVADFYYKVGANSKTTKARIGLATAAPNNVWSNNEDYGYTTADYWYSEKNPEWKHASITFTTGDLKDNGLWVTMLCEVTTEFEVYIDDITVTLVGYDAAVTEFVGGYPVTQDDGKESLVLARPEGTTIDYVPANHIKADGTPYSFNGWYADEDFIEPVTTYSKDNPVLYAKWNKPSYVMFNTNGGNEIPKIQATVDTWFEVDELPTPVKAGFTFEGWYADPTFETVAERFLVTGDKTFYANWIENDSYTQDFENYDLNGNNAIYSLATDEEAYSGTNAIKLDSTKLDWTNYAFNTGKAVTPGETYVLDYYYKVTAGANNGILRFSPAFSLKDNFKWGELYVYTLSNFTNEEYVKGADEQYVFHTWEYNKGNDWVHAYIKFTVPANLPASQSFVWLNLTGNNSTTCTAYIDDLTFTKVGENQQAIAIYDAYEDDYGFNNVIFKVADNGALITDIIDVTDNRASEGNTFLGWYADEDREVAASTVDADHTSFYVKWSEGLIVTFTVEGEDPVTMNAHPGDKITDAPALNPEDGYVAVWTVNGQIVDVANYEINAATEFVAVFGLANDVNGDGKVNVKDLARLERYLAGTAVVNVASADLTGDKAIDAKDLTRLKKFFAGINE